MFNKCGRLGTAKAFLFLFVLFVTEGGKEKKEYKPKKLLVVILTVVFTRAVETSDLISVNDGTLSVTMKKKKEKENMHLVNDN